MTEIENARRLVASEDWSWAKSKLESMCEAYTHARLTGTDTQVGREYKRRQDVAALLQSWFDEIEGTAVTPLPDENPDSTIVRFDDSPDV